MRLRTARVLLLACTLVAGLARAADLPAELVGVWATPESEFDGETLLGGEALYLLKSGKVALLGAPLPVRRCADGTVCAPLRGLSGSARYDAAAGKLAITLLDGQRSVKVAAAYAAGEKTISLPTEPGKVARYRLHGAAVPETVAAELERGSKKP